MGTNKCIYHPTSQGLAFCKRCNGYICKDCIIVVDGRKWCKKCYDDFKNINHSVPAKVKCINHPQNVGISYCKKCGGYICRDCMIAIGEKKFCKKCYDEYQSGNANQSNKPVLPRCINHPEKIGSILCEECKTYLCEECVIIRDGHKKCRKCDQESQAKLAEERSATVADRVENQQNQGQQTINIQVPSADNIASSRLLIFAIIGAILGIPLSYYFQSQIVQSKVGGIGGYLNQFGEIVKDGNLLANVILSVVIFALVGGVIGYFIDQNANKNAN